MAPYPAGYEFPVPFGDRRPLLGSSCPRRGICLPCGRLTAGRHREMIPGRPRRDFRVPHDERCDRGGCLLCAGAEVSAAGPMEPRFVRPRRRCRRRVRRPSPPYQPSVTAVRYITTLCVEGSIVHPSDLRLARISPMAGVVLGLSSGLHTVPLPARHAGCGDRAGHCSRTHEVTPFMRLTRRTHCL